MIGFAALLLRVLIFRALLAMLALLLAGLLAAFRLVLAALRILRTRLIVVLIRHGEVPHGW